MKYKTVADIEKDINDLRLKIENLEKEKSKIKELDIYERIAELLHDALCHWNHTDGCGWGYSTWENPCDTRKRYKAKAVILFNTLVTYTENQAYECGIDPEELSRYSSDKRIEELLTSLIKSIKDI